MGIKFLGPAAFLLSQTSKNIATKINRATEKQANKINPKLGQTVRKFNETAENLHDTVNNFLDANDPVNLTVRSMKPHTSDFQLGDHLYVQRPFYTHHGIYIGSNTVIHYLQDQGITFASFEKFSLGAKIHTKNSPKKYTNAEIIVRARSRVGESNYNLFGNNCENFVRWCRSGRL